LNEQEKFIDEMLYQIHGIADFAHWKLGILALGGASTGLSCILAISAIACQFLIK
jgi:hypothetical protein